MPQPDTSQEAVFAFLSRPAVHGGAAVKRVDTHAASVFLAGERAYKVKRAVRFPFLDYSTLDRRKLACDAELRVNRAFAPDIYRQVVPITRAADGELALGGDGEPVEWAVEMRRFDEDATLDRLAEQGRIDVALADQLGTMVGAAHKAAPIVDAAPWLGAVATFLEQNRAAFREQLDLFPAAQATRLDRASRSALTRLRPLLRRRGERGLVRRGHGDLHLGNIVLIEGRPVMFDAIEFDPLIAAGDGLYDLAFLIMDLIERGLAAPANVVLNRYLAETHREEDLDGLAALPFFLSLRAAIRAKVTAARIARGDGSRAQIARTARIYFDLACRLIAPPPPRLIAIGGLSGTGKSLLTHALAPGIAPEPGAVVLRSDVERKSFFGLRDTERLPPAAYAADITAGIYATLTEKAMRVLAAGHSAVVDAVFGRPHEREAIEAVARRARVEFRPMFLTAELASRVMRVAAREHDASDADPEIVRQQELYDLGSLTWTRIDASGTPEDTLANAKAFLA